MTDEEYEVIVAMVRVEVGSIVSMRDLRQIVGASIRAYLWQEISVDKRSGPAIVET